MTRRSVATAATLAAVFGLVSITALMLTWQPSSLHPASTASSSASAREAGRPIDSKLRANRIALRSLINDTSRLEDHIRELTRTSSLAGSETSMHQVEYVENYWRQLGFRVIRRTYEVPMSYFNSTDEPQPSVSICQRKDSGPETNTMTNAVPDSASIACTALEMDKPLTQEDRDIQGISRTFYAYSKPLQGDFGLLLLSDIVNTRGNLTEVLSGNLVLIQPNETAAMEHLMRLAANISTGFLLVHVPPGTEDAAPGSETEAPADAPYPNGTGSPDTAVTFHLGLGDDSVGDPTTPGFPSRWYATRRAPKGGWDDALNATVVPISEADTERLVEAFLGAREGAEPPFLRVHWPLRFGYRSVHDSCAEVTGWAEPDRVVLLGSHRDAWYGGAIDPHTGVATMLETSWALAHLMSTTGWRPRRTILMCAWDAEEIGLVGSVEWLEEEYLRAGARLVAYFNTDTDVMGNWKILVQASDQMVDAIRSVMTEVPNPTESLTKLPAASPYFFFYALDDSSDYYAFTRALGVPACDLSYIRGPQETLVLYDLYHTRYETLSVYRAMDPEGLAHQGLAQSVASLVYTFADSPLLPLNMSAFADGLGKRFLEVTPDADGASNATTPAIRELLGVMQSALVNATRALHRFQGRLDRARTSGAGELKQRMLNDKVMLVQKAFTHHCVFPCDGASVNLLNGLEKVTAVTTPEKLIQTIILGLNSVPKILTDSFVEE